jgi:undecaprenyl diphosphate synthase
LDQSRARHVAIIMDGNGRWAKKRGLPRAVGHQRGVEAVRRLVRALEPTRLECLTLYAFSSENWKRSEDEVDDLMNLMRKFIKSDLPEFVANNVKLKIIGDWQSLAPDIVAMLEDALAQSSLVMQALARDLARAATPKRVNVVAGAPGEARAAALHFLSDASGVTGQYLVCHE